MSQKTRVFITKLRSLKETRSIQKLCLSRPHEPLALLHEWSRNVLTREYWSQIQKIGYLGYIRVVIRRRKVVDLVFTGPKWFQGCSPVSMDKFLLAIMEFSNWEK